MSGREATETPQEHISKLINFLSIQTGGQPSQNRCAMIMRSVQIYAISVERFRAIDAVLSSPTIRASQTTQEELPCRHAQIPSYSTYSLPARVRDIRGHPRTT